MGPTLHPELIDAARHVVGGCWFVDETYVRCAGVWRYVYRAVDQHGQVIDILVSARRDGPLPAGSSTTSSVSTPGRSRSPPTGPTP